MRRYTPIILAFFLLALAACSTRTPTASPTAMPSTPSAEPTQKPSDMPPALLSEGEYPRVDGSTATIPLSAALLSRACAIPLEEAELYVSHSTTNYAYNNLLNGICDLLLVYEPPAGAREYAEFLGKPLEEALEMTPIGRDALVFLTNSGNPVRSLGALQIVSIYQGGIANWKEVGGEDMPIAAFQRDADSGSQTLMRKLVMRGAEMSEPEVDMVPGTMGEMIESIKEYDNSKSALGYSVYYYVKNMIGIPELKTLSVDGIEPSEATISDGSYPYTNDFYVAIRKSEPEGSPARLLYDFLLSAQGKELVEKAGYVALP